VPLLGSSRVSLDMQLAGNRIGMEWTLPIRLAPPESLESLYGRDVALAVHAESPTYDELYSGSWVHAA